MPRNAQGQYFLPDGNPVTPGELIKAEWANSTMDDLANAMTNSLDRAGAGGMTGQFKAAAGTLSRPSIAFVEDVTSGLYKESAGVVAAVAEGGKQAYWTKNGFYLTSNPNSQMEAATKAYVDTMNSQITEIIGSFGASKTPADLPPSGYIPANWDAPGVPAYNLQMKEGQSLVYLPANTADPLYNNVIVFTGVIFTPSGWTNVGKVTGPVGPQGEPGPLGPDGPQGPIGPQGDTGDVGPTGPAGSTGPQGPIGPQGTTGEVGPAGATGPAGPKGDDGAVGPTGPQGTTGEVGPAGPTGPEGPKGDDGPQGLIGPQGPAGEPAVLVGSFGASKVPADLPPNGYFPANWDSPGNPPVARQLIIGQALIYTDCPVGTPSYGHVFSFVGVGFDANGWVDAGDIAGPAGPTGPQGTTGETGPAGSAGPQGPKGDDGGVGPQGPQGTTGETGPAGAVGPQGPKGDDGGVGPQGPQGPTGSQGPAGSDGAQGPQGIQGAKGDTGSQGPQGVPGSDATVTSSAIQSALGYLPPGTVGQNASGTWPIAISGNATTATNANYANSSGSTASINGASAGTVNGDFTATGNVTAFSDETLKKDWDSLPADFVKLLAELKSGTYTRIDSGDRQAGVSAQSLQAFLKECVMEDADGILSVAYGNAALVSCVELAKAVEELKKEIASLKRR